MLKVVRDESIENFLAQAGTLLYQEEATYNLMLGLCEGMLISPPKQSPLLIRLVKESKTLAAAIQMPTMNLVITQAQPTELTALAEYLRDMNAEFPGVVGPAKASEFFANQWVLLTGKKLQLGMAQKIYKLEQVRFPAGVQGVFRVASAEDLELVLQWTLAFARESLPEADSRGEAYWRESSEKAVQKQTAHLWVKDGQPVSIAFVSRSTKNGASVNGVYTPPEHRKQGYASAVVAHLSQKMLDAGKDFCVLYTDLANPTSNKIYQEICYREVADSKHFLFV